MSLTARNFDGKVYSPYLKEAMSDFGSFATEVRKLCRLEQLYCPHCYAATGFLYPVNFRNPESRRAHFYHVGSDHRCANYKGESERHEKAKLRICADLTDRATIVDVEPYDRDPESGHWRKPDVRAEYSDGRKEAHEIQLSSINPLELIERTQALFSLGFTAVHWYMGSKNYRQEQRDYLWKTKQAFCYQLTFEKDGKPKYRPDRGFATKPVSKRETAVDRCYSKSRLSQDELKVQLSVNGWTYWKKIDTVAQLISVGPKSCVVRAPGMPSKKLKGMSCCIPIQKMLADPLAGIWRATLPDNSHQPPFKILRGGEHG
jgi:hypothetical protein